MNRFDICDGESLNPLVSLMQEKADLIIADLSSAINNLDHRKLAKAFIRADVASWETLKWQIAENRLAAGLPLYRGEDGDVIRTFRGLPVEVAQ